ncbi:methyltransferase type 11 [Meredithblackwellia eburnea MCA 4105]
MFSGTNTPERSRKTVTSRRSSRSALSSALQSGQSTPRAETPPLPTHTPRSLGADLNAASRALSAPPGPHLTPSARRARSVTAPSEVSTMDVEDGGAKAEGALDRILVRDDSYIVKERKGLPVEVSDALFNADPYTDPFRASLDTLTGFAYLVTRDACLVWNWSRRSSTSTTFIFPLPISLSLPANISVFSPLSFASLVPSSSQSTQREPGLVVISTTGEIRYWESVSMALSGVDKWKAASAGLHESELVRGLEMFSPTSYLVATSQSRVLVLTLTSTSGKSGVDVRPLEQTVGWAGSVWSAVFGGRTHDPRAGILALALSPRVVDGERLLYAVTDKDVQIWNIAVRQQGGERLLVEQDLFGGVLEALTGSKVGNEDWAMNKAKAEILDVKVRLDGKLAVLVSHVSNKTAPHASSYAIVHLDVGHTQGSVTVVGIQYLGYQSHPDPRPLSTPKLVLTTIDTAFVVFIDVVVMVSIGSNAPFEESFPLRSSAARFLGVSSLNPTSSRSLTLLTSSPTLISIDVTSSQPFEFDQPGSEGFKTRKLKNKLEQAIFFGGKDSENPLAFDLSPDFEGDLIAASLAVSTELLASSSVNMPPILDLRVQLADRVTRARGLVDFVNSNGLQGKLSQSARRQLSWDAEKLSASAALWYFQNANIGEEDNLLGEAIGRYMTESGEGFGEDPVRLFFRTKVSALGVVLEHITKLAKSHVSTGDPGSSSPILHQANHLLLIVLNAVGRTRAEASVLYGLDSNLLPLEAWTSRPNAIDNLQWHFDSTDALLRERVRDLGINLDDDKSRGGRSRTGTTDLTAQHLQGEFKKQMASVADHAFAAFEERLLYLKSINSDGAASAEIRVLSERYQTIRPRFIRTLVSIGKVTHAFDLAERFRDFRSLVELCNDPEHGSKQRTRFFLQKYSEAFAVELYQYYVEKGHFRALLEPEATFQPLVTQFLDSTDNSRVSWINDIAIRRYERATEVLVHEALGEQSLAQKKLMLSLGKLAKVAQMSRAEVESEQGQQVIEVFDDILDLVNAQADLQQAMVDTLSAGDLQLPVVEQAALVTTNVTLGLEHYPAFAQYFPQLCQNVLEGTVVSPEDLIDLVTLQRNMADQGGDFFQALQIIERAKDLPEARKRIALQTIWRRIYIRDDWSALRTASDLSDDQMADALRNTALYKVLVNAADEHLSPESFLQASEALFDGSEDEVAARFPSAPPQFLLLWMNDFEAESRELEEAISSHELETFCGEIERLFREREALEDETAIAEEGLGDDSMMDD